MKTAELLNEWLTTYERERVKPRTYARYEGLINLHIAPALGEVEINELCRRQIQEFLTRKKKDGNIKQNGESLSATSTNLMLTVLNLAFEYACDMEIVEMNPCTRLKRAPEETRAIDAFTKEEQRKLEQVIEESNDPRLFGILLCLYTGLRIGELLGYMARHHEDHEKTFTDEQKEIFEKFHDCWSEYMSLAEAAIFEYAFKLGMNIAIESLSDNSKNA